MVTLKGASPELYGVEDDTKPLDAAVNTIFTELDTGKKFYFDGEQWQEIGGGGE